MAFDATIDLTGDKRVGRAFENISKTARGTRPLLLAIGSLAKGVSQSSFRSESDPVTGRPWVKSKFKSPIKRTNRTLFETGRLLSAVTGAPMSTTRDSVTLKVLHPGARTHQFGATITPKRGKFLTIPLTRKAANAGSPRKFSDGFFKKSRAGNLIFVTPKEDGGIEAQFVLKEKVVIPRRRYLGLGPQGVNEAYNLVLAEMGWKV